MKRVVLLVLVAMAISFFVGSLISGRRHPSHDDMWLKLDNDVKVLINEAKTSLAKGADFKVKVNGVEVSSSRMRNLTQTGNATNQLKEISYFLFLPDTLKIEPPNLSGELILRQVSSTRANIVFRPGYLQIGVSDIGICLDEYDLGEIEWTSEMKSPK